MNPHIAHPFRMRWVLGPGLALAAVLVAAPGSARALSGDGIYYSRDADDGVYYSSQAAFRIPFQTDTGDRRIQEVVLHVSTDFGRTYQKVTTAGPNEKEFRFEARHDGWYWFTVQTRDVDGRFYPPDLNLAQPALKVCVDTHPPIVSVFRWLPPHDGLVGVEWDVSDANLDAATMRVDYRTANGEWTPLPIKQAPSGQYFWNPGTNAQIEARLEAQDKAHNPVEAKAPPAAGSFKTGIGPTPAPGSGPVPTTVAPAASDPAPNVIMVNTRRIQLDYNIDDIGSSKVKAVEVWYTRDGHAWQKSPQDAGPEPPYVVEVQAEGRYGFTLIARSGVGLALPNPKAGDLPQVWVEVDETKPKVTVVGVEVGRGPDMGMMTVRWTAADPHIAATPITISYCDATAGAAGPWQIMAGPIANDGRYTWRIPENLPPQILVRVEAVDQAGNVGSADLPNPVSTDLSIPKARVTQVRGAKGTGTGTGTSPMPPP